MKKIVKGQLYEQIQLAPFTYWRIGGKADRLYWPCNLADLQRFLAQLDQQEPVTWLGLGSNVLISDQGIRGTVIITRRALQEQAMTSTNQVYAQAGISCAKVARFAAHHDLGQGGEFLAGIPGTLGGALYMNAGAFGGEIWDHVESVEVINRSGQLQVKPKTEFNYGYRFCQGLDPDSYFVGAVLQFADGDGAASLAKIKSLLKHRSATQPAGEACCGSVFQNPTGDYAGRLIEAAGLKGKQIGGAQVSPQHANFIVNTGNASACDVVALISQLQDTIQQQFNIKLKTEVKFIGEGFAEA